MVEERFLTLPVPPFPVGFSSLAAAPEALENAYKKLETGHFAGTAGEAISP